MGTSPASLDDRLEQILPRLQNAVRESAPRPAKGRVRRLLGVTVHASVPQVRLGELCHLVDPVTSHKVMAEVIGLADDLAVLTPIGDLTGLSSVSEVVPTGAELRIPVRRGGGCADRRAGPRGERVRRAAAWTRGPQAHGRGRGNV